MEMEAMLSIQAEALLQANNVASGMYDAHLGTAAAADDMLDTIVEGVADEEDEAWIGNNMDIFPEFPTFTSNLAKNREMLLVWLRDVWEAVLDKIYLARRQTLGTSKLKAANRKPPRDDGGDEEGVPGNENALQGRGRPASSYPRFSGATWFTR